MDQAIRWSEIIWANLDDWLAAVTNEKRFMSTPDRDVVSFVVSQASNDGRSDTARDPSALWPIAAAAVTMIGGFASAFLVLTPY